MPVILFVCTANQFRSPLAAAYTQKKLLAAGLSAGWTIASAGTWAVGGIPAHPQAQHAAAALGLDLSAHRSRDVNRPLMQAADLIVVMDQGHKEALEHEFPASRDRLVLLGALAGVRNPDVPDPGASAFEDSLAVSHMIVAYIDQGFDEMLRRAARTASEKRRRSASQ